MIPHKNDPAGQTIPIKFGPKKFGPTGQMIATQFGPCIFESPQPVPLDGPGQSKYSKALKRLGLPFLLEVLG